MADEMRNKLRRLKSESGQTAIEFALAVPFLIAFVFFLIDTALVGYSYVSLTNAVREGARCAVVGGTDAAVVQRITDTSGGLGAVTGVTTTPNGRTLGNTVTVAATFNYNFITPVNILPGINVPPLPITKISKMRMETSTITKATC